MLSLGFYCMPFSRSLVIEGYEVLPGYHYLGAFFFSTVDEGDLFGPVELHRTGVQICAPNPVLSLNVISALEPVDIALEHGMGAEFSNSNPIEIRCPGLSGTICLRPWLAPVSGARDFLSNPFED